MKCEPIVVLGLAMLLVYSGTSVLANTEAPDVCCSEQSDCTEGYACDKSGDECEPTLTGRCVKVPD
jgi:hypothetical protein